MADYQVTFARSARKELECLGAEIVGRIFRKIERLAEQPRPAGCLKLVGENNLWRIRISDYRVIYSIDDKREVVDVVAVRHRREAYD
ncbi:MAG: type II toxin-antitoxin system RelE/ParE family toxin [Acidobacteriota bacterium]|nr:type II toxin-antitoxin system RelE/ParE family toxin [Acidobacteriota bacterium]